MLVIYFPLARPILLWTSPCGPQPIRTYFEGQAGDFIHETRGFEHGIPTRPSKPWCHFLRYRTVAHSSREADPHTRSGDLHHKVR